VFGYARPSDWAIAGGMASAAPISFWIMERASPSHVGRGGFAPVMRLASAVGLIGGLHILYQRSCRKPILFAQTILGFYSQSSQSASTVSLRTPERLKWTPVRWSIRSRRASLCTASLRCLLTYKAWLPVTPGTRSSSSMSSHGSTLSTMTR
jgi:hypothetical protein